MDDLVKQAMAKWPNVPDCYGWLGLDRRGDWYMRDDGVQAAGPFPQSRGAVLRHAQLVAFICRNYMADDQGRWFFQNGPQRVYVELESTPYIWRIAPDFSVESHNGLPAGKVNQALVDEAGMLYLVTDLGCGIVHTLDMHQAADAVEQGQWTPEEIEATTLPTRCGFTPHPSNPPSP